MSWFRPRGRIGRAVFWLAYAVPLGVVSLVAGGILLRQAGLMLLVMTRVLTEDDPEAAAAIAALAEGADPPSITRFAVSALVLLVAQALAMVGAARRWHDLGQSGWWSWLLPVPVGGWVVGFLVLGCLPGQREANRFGPGRGGPLPASAPVPLPPPPVAAPPPAPGGFRSPWG